MAYFYELMSWPSYSAPEILHPTADEIQKKFDGIYENIKKFLNFHGKIRTPAEQQLFLQKIKFSKPQNLISKRSWSQQDPEKEKSAIVFHQLISEQLSEGYNFPVDLSRLFHEYEQQLDGYSQSHYYNILSKAFEIAASWFVEKNSQIDKVSPEEIRHKNGMKKAEIEERVRELYDLACRTDFSLTIGLQSFDVNVSSPPFCEIEENVFEYTISYEKGKSLKIKAKMEINDEAEAVSSDYYSSNENYRHRLSITEFESNDSHAIPEAIQCLAYKLMAQIAAIEESIDLITIEGSHHGTKKAARDSSFSDPNNYRDSGMGPPTGWTLSKVNAERLTSSFPIFTFVQKIDDTNSMIRDFTLN